VNRFRRLALVAVILIASVGCDQATKHFARHTLVADAPISMFGDSIHFERAENHGAFLSLGANLPVGARRIVFVICGAAVLAAVALAALFGPGLRTVQVLGLSLVLGGGIGNLIDRLSNDGAVTDFVRIGLGRISTGIFNLSDVAILLGIAVFALARGNATNARSDAA
jgi:signal peptidase II